MGYIIHLLLTTKYKKMIGYISSALQILRTLSSHSGVSINVFY
jgi:hypothetical protein